MQNRIWYIKVDDQKKGPYSIQELKFHPRMTPDTLVWKEGFKNWIPARKVAELKSLFEDSEEIAELQDPFKIRKASADNSTLALEGSNLPFLFYVLVILLIILVYLFYKFHRI